MPRRDPFGDIEELFERLSHEFEEMGGGIGSRLEGGINVDVAEDEETVTVTADLPGFESEDIDVSVKDQHLTIAAEHDEETEESGPESEESGLQYHRRERRQRSVSRTVRLPVPVQEHEAKATFKNGVLTVELPKSSPEESGGHSIDIS